MSFSLVQFFVDVTDVFQSFDPDWFLAALRQPAGNRFSLDWNPSKWDWTQILNPEQFEWQIGTTPLSDLRAILATWAVYALTITGLRVFMAFRSEGFKLKYATAAHNLFLCAISLLMTLTAVYYATTRILSLGWAEAICPVTESGIRSAHKGIGAWVMYIYYLSKKPIIFLHWYHHAIVILMVWSWNEYAVQIGQYWYYTASQFGFNVWYKKYITTGQIVQFFLSLVGSSSLFFLHQQRGCEDFAPVIYGTAVNISFLLLFINFYQNAYKKPKGKKKVE
ncbi:GNS1/SUR4 family-domain-containing protein [Gorgonomyces haynaldii]|nr:GNS1/SUR4 family-domain-containing protein [Gorgonomyces haynaldii]